MGCSSCSTTTGGSPGGCQNNGTCGTTGCNKLNVYNWLSDMTLPDGQKQFPIVEVRFKNSRKEFFRNKNEIALHEGDVVAVEGSPGHDIGVVSMAGELVRLQLKKKNVEENSAEVKTLYRIAKGFDLEKWEQMKALEVKTMFDSRTIAIELGLKMKLSDVEYQGDGKKATFYYTAEDRVDFRELIKRLADRFKVRIEMRQIGMRQEASRLGGIGSCGRELCCSTWLTDFKAVTTSAARYQNLSLNPIKLAGQCGKLKCCLNYELDSYMDAVKDFPDTNLKLELQKGYAKHVKTDIFKRMMWYSFTSTETRGDEWHPPGSDAWIPLSVDRVKEVLAMNKVGEKPAELVTDIEVEVKEILHDYENVVGQDSITRMDNKKKKKKKKPQNQQRQGQQQFSNPNQAAGQQQQGENPTSQTAPDQGQQRPVQPFTPRPAQQQKKQGQKPQQQQGQQTQKGQQGNQNKNQHQSKPNPNQQRQQQPPNPNQEQKAQNQQQRQQQSPNREQKPQQPQQSKPEPPQNPSRPQRQTPPQQDKPEQ
ncbi:MAG: regulatory iron-sulfur-containing complex subunit RicT [Bacteroidia bacterium]